MKKLTKEDFVFNNWRLFWKVSFIALSVTTVSLFMTNRIVSLVMLIATQICYLPFVIVEFKRAMKKKE